MGVLVGTDTTHEWETNPYTTSVLSRKQDVPVREEVP